MWERLIGLGGRKFFLVFLVILLAVINDAAGLGISKETLNVILLAALCGSGTIAIEDGLKAMFGGRRNEVSSDDLASALAQYLSADDSENEDTTDLLDEDETEDDNESE